MPPSYNIRPSRDSAARSSSFSFSSALDGIAAGFLGGVIGDGSGGFLNGGGGGEHAGHIKASANSDWTDLFRFEKSLYDLIRGLRQHKGNEKAYINQSLKECRQECRNVDGDVKATAILKLIYLEMFGYDMSWASFNVLEVMSSPKFVHKRIGYLAAVQSFRLETEVLMLTTNQIKKDLSSSSIYDVSIAINGLAHIVSPSLARDLSTDLISKMNHSNPYIRKKAILVMYKCFLQCPELLRTSWTKLKEGLNDEDGSVVSATVNVICELARKNPRNYLPLAPTLFQLLTNSTNNWMTIKIIKLFATLTPLEPRLIRKLIPPITKLIQTTPAMSLLYECINGLVSGGLLAGIADTQEGENLAKMCVEKLRAFLEEGDANLKYVGLLAFTKIVESHAHLVAEHQDVIMECIDDPDISIRLRALELSVGMVNSDNLPQVVGKLIRQLKPSNEWVDPLALDPYTAVEEEDMEEGLRPGNKQSRGPPVEEIVLPESYKVGVIRKILEMCSRDMYANVADFEWYLDVLVQLVRYCPPVGMREGNADEEEEEEEEEEQKNTDVGEEIGFELKNVAVRVKDLREEAVKAAALLVERKEGMYPSAGGGGRRVLHAAGWIVGEYASLLESPYETITALLNVSSQTLPADILAIYIQAIPKVYAALAGIQYAAWTPERRTTITLLTDRIISFLEIPATSPNLEVQERAVEFLEFFKLLKQAIEKHPADSVYGPQLLTEALPALFQGQELNPVSAKAQRKVPLPEGLDLDAPINPNLAALLQGTELDISLTPEEQADYNSYYTRPKPVPLKALSAASHLDSILSSSAPTASTQLGSSYQSDESYLDPDILARRRAERRRANIDDPFYIGTPQSSAQQDIDIDNIPNIKLDLSLPDSALPSSQKPKKKPKKATILIDENLDGDDDLPEPSPSGSTAGSKRTKKKNILASSDPLKGYSIEPTKEELEERAALQKRLEAEDAERMRALAAASEAQRAAAEATKVVKKKKKAKTPGEEGEKKKKKKKKGVDGEAAEGEVKPKKKKKKVVVVKEGQEDKEEASLI